MAWRISNGQQHALDNGLAISHKNKCKATTPNSPKSTIANPISLSCRNLAGCLTGLETLALERVCISHLAGHAIWATFNSASDTRRVLRSAGGRSHFLQLGIERTKSAPIGERPIGGSSLLELMSEGVCSFAGLLSANGPAPGPILPNNVPY